MDRHFATVCLADRILHRHEGHSVLRQGNHILPSSVNITLADEPYLSCGCCIGTCLCICQMFNTSDGGSPFLISLKSSRKFNVLRTFNEEGSLGHEN